MIEHRVAIEQYNRVLRNASILITCGSRPVSDESDCSLKSLKSQVSRVPVDAIHNYRLIAAFILEYFLLRSGQSMSSHLQVLQNFKYSKSCVFVILALVLLLDDQIKASTDAPLWQRKDESSSSSYYSGGGERCGSFQIPFPFCLNASSASSSPACKWSGLLSGAFSLSCHNSSSLFLNIASQSYRVLYFFQDGVLVEFPNTSFCHRGYNDLNSFPFAGDQYFGISTDNVVALYGCQDASPCKTDCGKSLIPGCDHDGSGAAAGVGGYPACCYPLSDFSINGFSFFSQFGCRGLSSWVILPRNRSGMGGVKLEWAIPRNSTLANCATNADAINASSVKSGMRCQCRDGFLGDGFAFGFGCFKCELFHFHPYVSQNTDTTYIPELS